LEVTLVQGLADVVAFLAGSLPILSVRSFGERFLGWGTKAAGVWFSVATILGIAVIAARNARKTRVRSTRRLFAALVVCRIAFVLGAGLSAMGWLISFAPDNNPTRTLPYVAIPLGTAAVALAFVYLIHRLGGHAEEP